MVVSRRRPRGARSYASLGLGVLVMGLMPRTIGYQDLASLMARQPDVSQRARAHMMTSPFGTIHAATFSFPQPVGTADPGAAARPARQPREHRQRSGDHRIDPVRLRHADAVAPATSRFPVRQPRAQGRSAGVAAARRACAQARSHARAGEDGVVPAAGRHAAGRSCRRFRLRRRRRLSPKASRRSRRAKRQARTGKRTRCADAVGPRAEAGRRARGEERRAARARDRKPERNQTRHLRARVRIVRAARPAVADRAAAGGDRRQQCRGAARPALFRQQSGRRRGRPDPALADGRGMAGRGAAFARSRSQAVADDLRAGLQLRDAGRGPGRNERGRDRSRRRAR